MKLASRWLIIGSIALILFAACGTPPKTDQSSTPTETSVRELVLEPSAPVRVRTPQEISEMTPTCLWCHGFAYEEVQALTVNYVYQGEVVQPHAFLDMALTNPHNTTKGIDCLNCHDEHEVPEPVGTVKKANLNYCINCHHTGEMISCSFCH